MTPKLLILDLDETLIYSTENPLDFDPDFTVDRFLVYRRPFLKEFLHFGFEHFKVAVWTSSSEDYADLIVKNIFGSERKLEFIWARKRCTLKFDSEMHESGYIKDLNKVKKKGFPLESMIMVDNTPSKLRRNYGNLVHVNSFEGDMEDSDLLDLIKYLDQLKCKENIRSIEKRGWQTRS